MIKNVIFDMGGVLLDIDRERCVEAFTAIGFPQAETMLNHFAQTGIFGDLETGLISPAEFFDYVRGQIGHPVSDTAIAGALDAFIVGLPDYKLQMVEELAARFNIYMLSNTNAIMMPTIRAKYFTQAGRTFDDYFAPERTFLSYEMHLMKPAPEIFLEMAHTAGIRPEESLFIDDGPANVVAAAALGFQTYLPQHREDFRGLFH